MDDMTKKVPPLLMPEAGVSVWCDWCQGSGVLEYDEVFGPDTRPCDKCQGTGIIPIAMVEKPYARKR